ncbi:MAG: sigma 54-interacting transcriptional regulator [Deltaproteobacteria bacterium]|nr:sigma 54-interacting transcriptional regulator [Deltaproteobacteria bacterium]MCW5803267.1 sigma 54-interacting transcriptional regulator [Deltaproteobacteria bacterium]
MIEDEPGATTEQIDREAPFGDRVLLVIDGAALQVMPLPGSGSLTIGRASKADVVIDSGSVSRHHANLIVGTDVEVEDVGSSNGTFVDGAKLPTNTRVKLLIGVPFLIGAVTVMVQTRAGSRRESTPVSSQLAALEQSAARIAIGKLAVIIVGEHGVGKERFAERIHEMSPRRAQAFVRINCAAISEPLLEAELFGIEAQNKAGLIELADGGTGFLSDVDQLPAGLQQKLLRVLEDAAVRRTGSARARPVDVRYIASTTKDLAAEVDAGRFRRDLYFRLAGAAFTIPPLRDRKDEVLPLAEQFIASAAGPLGRGFTFDEEARQWLSSHDWPGNIRELRNACERAVLLATGAVIERHHLTIDDPAKRAGPRFRNSPTIPPPTGVFPMNPHAPSAADMPSQVRATVAELEKQRILEALDRCAGNQTRAAELLGISRRTLINRLDEYGIARPRKREE